MGKRKIGYVPTYPHGKGDPARRFRLIVSRVGSYPLGYMGNMAAAIRRHRNFHCEDSADLSFCNQRCHGYVGRMVKTHLSILRRSEPTKGSPWPLRRFENSL